MNQAIWQIEAALQNRLCGELTNLENIPLHWLCFKPAPHLHLWESYIFCHPQVTSVPWCKLTQEMIFLNSNKIWSSTYEYPAVQKTTVRQKSANPDCLAAPIVVWQDANIESSIPFGSSSRRCCCCSQIRHAVARTYFTIRYAFKQSLPMVVYNLPLWGTISIHQTDWPVDHYRVVVQWLWIYEVQPPSKRNSFLAII